MRHRTRTKRFGRSSAHLAVLLASQVRALINERRIVTTLAKARASRSLAEKMVTLAKAGSLSARRRAVQVLGDKAAVKSLFADIAPNFKDRSGGYCRITKLGSRRSDSAPMAVLEWIGLIQVDRSKKEKAEEKKQA